MDFNELFDTEENEDRIPETLEEARQDVLSNLDVIKELLLACRMDVLLTILEEKGIINIDEYTQRVSADFDESVDRLAQKYLETLEGIGFGDEATD